MQNQSACSNSEEDGTNWAGIAGSCLLTGFNGRRWWCGRGCGGGVEFQYSGCWLFGVIRLDILANPGVPQEMTVNITSTDIVIPRENVICFIIVIHSVHYTLAEFVQD